MKTPKKGISCDKSPKNAMSCEVFLSQLWHFFGNATREPYPFLESHLLGHTFGRRGAALLESYLARCVVVWKHEHIPTKRGILFVPMLLSGAEKSSATAEMPSVRYGASNAACAVLLACVT
ncbi:hypothetical protein HMPREF1527_01516 [Atopobium sp. oral taxon 199 str. F0494]|nr:hypothetical protein HMPREF1527_01516 [Atopobium sp. oral taxon 199 str. F0494]